MSFPLHSPFKRKFKKGRRMDDISHSELSRGSEERSMILSPINTDVRENCSAACLAPPDSYRSSCYCSIRQRYEKYLQEKPHHSHLVSHFKINQIYHMDHNFLNLLIKHRIEDVPGDGIGRGKQSPEMLEKSGLHAGCLQTSELAGEMQGRRSLPLFSSSQDVHLATLPASHT